MSNLTSKMHLNTGSILILCFIFILGVETSHGQQRKLPADTSVVSTHQVKIDGQKIPYKVSVGTLPIYVEDGDDKPGAYVQYTYYKRSDVDDEAKRPILFSFNGGPGTGSLWMHIGYTGPKRLKVSSEGWPVQPYGVEDNHHSILDAADLVFVNPVNTGFSRIINDGEKKNFFGTKVDAEYLSDWIELFLSRNDRWTSPKFLMGESYGTTRVAGMAGVLQSNNNIFLDGVILQGNCGIGLTPDRSSPISKVLKLPSYTSAAWYHNKLSSKLQKQELGDIYSEVQDFTINELLPAVVKGGSIDQDRKEALAEQVARYSGLSKQYILDHNLIVPPSSFWKELLRDDGKTIGRLDTRYLGIDKKNAGERPDYSPELMAWENAFTPAINKYMRQDLGFKTDLKYYVFGPVNPWERNDDDGYNKFNVGDQLRQAMAENPDLELLNQQGYYDGACDVLTAKYSLWQLDPRNKFKDRIQFKAFESGHMLYIRDEDNVEGNNDLRQFIKNSVPEKGASAKHSVN